MNADHNYGRSPAEWVELEAVGWKFLLDTARQPVKCVTSYSELNHVLADNTGQPEWNFDRQADRAEELAAWLAVAAQNRDAGMWVPAATTGMRRSELAGAERDMLDLDAAILGLRS